MNLSAYLSEQGYVETEYLGDGAYIARSHHDVMLFTFNGETITRPVYLGSREIESLINYLKKIMEP